MPSDLLSGASSLIGWVQQVGKLPQRYAYNSSVRPWSDLSLSLFPNFRKLYSFLLLFCPFNQMFACTVNFFHSQGCMLQYQNNLFSQLLINIFYNRVSLLPIQCCYNRIKTPSRIKLNKLEALATWMECSDAYRNINLLRSQSMGSKL